MYSCCWWFHHVEVKWKDNFHIQSSCLNSNRTDLEVIDADYEINHFIDNGGGPQLLLLNWFTARIFGHVGWSAWIVSIHSLQMYKILLILHLHYFNLPSVTTINNAYMLISDTNTWNRSDEVSSVGNRIGIFRLWKLSLTHRLGAASGGELIPKCTRVV